MGREREREFYRNFKCNRSWMFALLTSGKPWFYFSLTAHERAASRSSFGLLASTIQHVLEFSGKFPSERFCFQNRETRNLSGRSNATDKLSPTFCLLTNSKLERMWGNSETSASEFYLRKSTFSQTKLISQIEKRWKLFFEELKRFFGASGRIELDVRM